MTKKGEPGTFYPILNNVVIDVDGDLVTITTDNGDSESETKSNYRVWIGRQRIGTVYCSNDTWYGYPARLSGLPDVPVTGPFDNFISVVRSLVAQEKKDLA